MTSPQPKVCVIGAGIAGIAAAKVLSEDSFDVTVFEKEQGLGGVWAETRAYPGLRTNTAKQVYCFSDHAYEKTVPDYPHAAEMRTYLESYLRRFGAFERIQFQREVVRVERLGEDGAPGFRVTVRDATDPSSPTVSSDFDFVVVCNGVFSTPVLPKIAGQDEFRGAIRHSSDFTDPVLSEGKRVIVVGSGKSALDCAAWAATNASSCTLVFRRAHWMIPRYVLGIPTDWLLQSRFSEAFLRYHRLNVVETLLHRYGKALVRLFWRMQMRMMRTKLKMPAALVPEHALPRGLESAGLADEFFSQLNSGRITAQRGAITAYTADGVTLDNGEHIEADIVVFGTGWQQDIAFLDEQLRDLVIKDGRFRLFRQILTPEEPRLAFIGYASTFANTLTAEVATHWLAQRFHGDRALPPVADMQREIDRVLSWVQEYTTRTAGFFLGPINVHYLDDLVQDMGLEPKRTGNFLTEYFGVSWPARYQGIGAERRQARSGVLTNPKFYLSGTHVIAALIGAAIVLWLF